MQSGFIEKLTQLQDYSLMSNCSVTTNIAIYFQQYYSRYTPIICAVTVAKTKTQQQNREIKTHRTTQVQRANVTKCQD